MAASSALAQPLTFGTTAGYAGDGSADGLGAGARFYNPSGVAVDSAGNLYVADTRNNTIRKVTPAGLASTLAGLAGVSGSADGTNGAARFFQPQGIAVDISGTVYVADSGNHTIRKVTAAGVVTTFAGLAGISGSADGTGTNSLFNEPIGLAVDGSGTLYVADYGNHTIRKITPGGVVSTLAGLAGNPGSADGAGTNAQFYQPEGVAVDSFGYVYVADSANQTVRKITPAGVVSTLAGLAGNFGAADGTGTNAQFYSPQGVTVDSSQTVYVADYFNNSIRKVTSGGVVSTLVGMPGASGIADGTNSQALFWGPASLAAIGPATPTLYVADSLNSTIRRLVPNGTNWVVSTLAGSPSSGNADGRRNFARFSAPQAVAVDANSDVYIADTRNSTIRKRTADGNVTTIAGQANHPGSADGTGTNAQFNGPQGIGLDSSGNLYVADTGNSAIRKMNAAGAVTTLAGVAGNPGNADGIGTNAQFYQPEGVVVDTAGNVYVTDSGNSTIRKVTPSGAVTTLAGTPSSPGSDDGTNNSALFNWPSGIALDNAGNLYVSDFFNHTIRQLSPQGTNWVVRTLAGLGGVWGSADGTNSDARFYFPRGLVADSAGNLYVLDSGNNSIRKLTPSGANWVVTTAAGNPDVSGSADGTGAGALFGFPAGVSGDPAGSLYLVDAGNNLLRSGFLTTNNRPTIITPPQSQIALMGSTVTFTVSAAGATPLHYQWQLAGTNLPNGAGAQLTLYGVNAASAGAYSVLITNAYGSAVTNAQLTVEPFVLDTALAGPPYASNSFRLEADGVLANHLLVLYRSADLVHWSPLFTNPPVAGSVQFVDTNAAAPALFYRAAEQ